MTEKLYYEDVYLQEFEAQVLSCTQAAPDQWAIVLDKTAFYPEGGGQPADQGWIDGVPVLTVEIRQGTILHITDKPLAAKKVKAQINWHRRFDHMQQHTGQHILSGVFFRVLEMKTVGFHLGSEGTYVDIATESLTEEQITKVEQTANQAIFENHPINCFFTKTQDFEKYNMRKAPVKQFEQVRLVNIADIDCCPCGGTHVAYTGEVGAIKILGIERSHKASRIEFVCGGRALRHFDEEHAILKKLCSELAAPTSNILQAVCQLKAKSDALGRQINSLRDERNHYLARLLLQSADAVQDTVIVTYTAKNFTPGEIISLSKECLAEQQAVILLAAVNHEQSKVHLHFACSPALKIQMGQVLKNVLPIIQGKGGGGASAAQGGGSKPECIEQALVQAKSIVIGQLTNSIHVV